MSTELKDELERRKLPIKGLKDDLVRMLSEAIQGEILDGREEKSGGAPPIEELKGGETPCQASMEQNVDEGPSEVTKQGSDAVSSVTEASNESLVATAEVSQEAVVCTAEGSQRTLDAITEVDAPLVDVELPSTDENSCKTNVAGLEASSSGNTMVKQVHSHSEVHDDTIDKTPEKDSIQKVVVVSTAEVSQRTLDVVTEVEAPLVELGLAPTDENYCKTNAVSLETASIHPHSEVHDDTIDKTPGDYSSQKMAINDVPSTSVTIEFEQESVTALPGTILLLADHTDTDVAAAAEPKDDPRKKMVVDGVLSDITSSTVKLHVNVDRKTEQQEVSAQPDAVMLHADVVATAENVIPKNNFSGNTLMDCKDHEDTKNTKNGDCKPMLCGTSDQVSELNPDLWCQTKHVSISHDNIPNNEKNNANGNMNADRSDLKVAVKWEMVEPPSTIHSAGDDLLASDGIKELHKNGTSLKELGSATNMDFDRKEDSPDASSLEKVSFDKSPGDESLDKDVLESKHADSNIKADGLGGKTNLTSDHVSKELTLVDTVTEGSCAHTKEVVVEEKPPNTTEKRKPENQGVIANNEPSKRRRQWNVDTVNVTDQQASKLTGIGTPKEVLRSVQKPLFRRSDSTANGDSGKERIVPPPTKSATTSLRIDKFVRPFTLKAVHELLAITGSICSFWMDRIKTHCYITYSSVEEAVTTRNAVYNLQWPPNNGSYLVAEFVDPQEVKHKLELHPPSQVPISPSTATVPQAASVQQSKANQTIHLHAADTSRGMLPFPLPLANLPFTSDPGPARERLPPPPKKLDPALTLDELFKKTKAYPRIFYMPLSEEEVSAKLAARDKGKRR
ncbi:hypothetical protein ACP4OV_028228 [Aristida adscensionis]